MKVLIHAVDIKKGFSHQPKEKIPTCPNVGDSELYTIVYLWDNSFLKANFGRQTENYWYFKKKSVGNMEGL